MTFLTVLRRPLLATVFAVASASPATADSITLSALSRGTVGRNAQTAALSGTSNGNFLTGFHGDAEFRSFFVFDLTGVKAPSVRQH